MLRSLLAGFAGALLVGSLVAFSARQAPRKAKGVRLLSWPAGMRWGVALMLPGSLAIAWMAAQAQPSQRTTATIVAGCFVLGAIYLAYCVFLYRVWWTKEGIGSWHMLGGSRFVPWSDVVEARYVESVQAFYVKGGGKRVWYSPMQSGISHLHRYIKTRVPNIAVSEAPLSGDPV